ncbi:hypothetical protein ABIC03_000573 [Bradyrhizobium sp. RT6a]|uniref:hypothetical protein n=1 Tax=unclassified Bradyrhizobium TaxID=2631580 RepID=UPI0033958ED9
MKKLLAITRNLAASHEEVAAVLAAAGVLTAAGWDWLAKFDPARAAQSMQLLGAKRIWVPPPAYSYDVVSTVASEIAEAWLHSFRDASEPGPARLLLKPSQRQWGDSERFALPPLVHAMLGGFQQLRGSWPSWTAIDQATVGSVAIKIGPGGGDRNHWKWPLRLSLEGIEPKSFDTTFRPAERGLSRTVKLGAPSEYAFVRSLDGLDAADTAFVTFISDESYDLIAPLLATGRRRAIRPVAWLQGADIDIKSLAKELIYETAHDAPPDLALNLAWLRAGGSAAPPIVFATQDYFEQMDAARLSQSVKDLSQQLRVLARTNNLPISILESTAYWFGVPAQNNVRPSELAEAIANAVEHDSISYQSEDHAAHATAQVTSLIADRVADSRRSADAKVTAEEIAPSPGTSEIETERFSDLSILTGSWWLGDLISDDARLAQDAPLGEASEYTLEVAIRANPIASKDNRKPIPPPRRTKESITIYARVIARADIKLADELLPITWPFDEDSTPALFRFSLGTAFNNGTLLEVRLLSGDLRLLDQIKYVFEKQQWSVSPVDPLATLARPASERARDALSLAISGARNGYTVQAELVRDGSTPLAVPLRQTIRSDDVARLLTDVRRHWTKLVIGVMSKRNQLTEPSYKIASDELAAFGREAWRLLFGDKRGGQTGTGETLGTLLADTPLPSNALVRVSFSDDAQDFTFPWSIVTPPKRKKEAASPQPWGLSYQIEIARAQGRTPPPKSGSLRMTAIVDDGFVSFVDHRKTLQDIVTANPVLALTQADLNDEIRAALVADNPSDIFYFFCHGMMASAPPALLAEMQAEIGAAVKALDKASQEPWQLLVNALGGNDGGARISSSRADFSERALRELEFFNGLRRPLVFLNMCHSASSLPASHIGLPAVFLDRDAIAVIGTEAPITAQFGDAFARALLGRLLNGEALGTAMLATRRTFHHQNNPLALIYTLYGRGDTRLVPKRPESPSPPTNNQPKEIAL